MVCESVGLQGGTKKQAAPRRLGQLGACRTERTGTTGTEKPHCLLVGDPVFPLPARASRALT
jgi:hypothetical protein